MKKVGFFAERVKPVIIMAALTIICIAIVSGIHLSTQDLVIANEGLFLKKAVLYAGGIKLPETNAEINELYEERVAERGDIFEISGLSGDIAAYAFIIVGPGLWGEIEAVTAFTPDLASFVGVEFVKQNETPGLGARITEPWFKEQMRGKPFPLRMVPEGTAGASGEIDAITGASRTSAYVLQIFNSAGEKAEKLRKEGI
ncbi:MAG: FMN-binding protein [Spirochaetales bacterium]|nr:FMN-binding protein [Spirochaetales bacterium]